MSHKKSITIVAAAASFALILSVAGCVGYDTSSSDQSGIEQSQEDRKGPNTDPRLGAVVTQMADDVFIKKMCDGTTLYVSVAARGNTWGKAFQNLDSPECAE